MGRRRRLLWSVLFLRWRVWRPIRRGLLQNRRRKRSAVPSFSFRSDEREGDRKALPREEAPQRETRTENENEGERERGETMGEGKKKMVNIEKFIFEIRDFDLDIDLSLLGLPSPPLSPFFLSFSLFIFFISLTHSCVLSSCRSTSKKSTSHSFNVHCSLKYSFLSFSKFCDLFECGF